MHITEEGKITLRDIMRTYHLSTYAVAAIAFVDTSLVYCMERGGALAKKDVEKILGRLSQVTGQNYSMETVGGYWIVEKEEGFTLRSAIDAPYCFLLICAG